MDFRRVGQRIIVAAYADLPNGLEIFSLTPILNQADPKITETANNIAKLLGSPEGTCRLI
jgi:hypothetical protein